MLAQQADLLQLAELDHRGRGDPAKRLAGQAAGAAGKQRRGAAADEKVQEATEDSLETERMEEAYSRIGTELANQGAELRRDRLLEHQWEESYANYSDNLANRPWEET